MNGMIILFIFIIFIVSAGSLAYIYKTTSLLTDVNNQIITKNNVIDDLTKKLEATKNNDYEKIKSDLESYKEKKSELENKLENEKKNNEQLSSNLNSCKNQKSETNATNTVIDDLFNKAFGQVNDNIKNNKQLINNYKYVGCYNSNNDVFNKNLIGKDLTINSCAKLANSKNYKYFSYKGTKGNPGQITVDLENNKIETNPLALGECYGENDFDSTKQSSSDKCFGQLVDSYISFYDMFNNQIINSVYKDDKLNIYAIEIGFPPIGFKDTISVYEKI